MVRTLYEYHQHRLTEIWASIGALSDAQFLQPIPYSIGSLRNQMVHLMDDELSWLSLVQGSVHEPIEPNQFATVATTRARSQEAMTKLHAFMVSLDNDALQSQFIWHPPFLKQPQRIAMWQAVLHIINHATDHRAQILRILHDLGAPTFDQDLMGYLIQSGKTASNQPT